MTPTNVVELLSRCKHLLDAPVGSRVDQVAETVLVERRLDPRMVGFVFNGLVIRVGDGDTVTSLYERYDEQSEYRRRITKPLEERSE